MTVKIVVLAKKRPDISFEEFRDYYTNRHLPFMHDLLEHGAAVHRRNFVIHPDPENPGEYDVISEVFYEDEAMLAATMRELQDPEKRRLRVEDEARFLLPESLRIFAVDVECTIFRSLPEKVSN